MIIGAGANIMATVNDVIFSWQTYNVTFPRHPKRENIASTSVNAHGRTFNRIQRHFRASIVALE